MLYYSTNHNAARATLREAVIRGLAEDRGLYMPEVIKQLPASFFDEIADLTFQEVAYRVADAFFGEDVPADDLRRIVYDTLQFDTPLVQVEPNIYALELFHGPTLAFKDVGARFMARLLQWSLTQEGEITNSQSSNSKLVNVLVATSGDTGSAVANGFLGVEGIHVYVLYPKGKVSAIQECQFTTLGQNITAIEVDGTFDDCQRLVKTAFMDDELNARMRLTSANSINVARFLPQAFYYFWAYAQLKRNDESRKMTNDESRFARNDESDSPSSLDSDSHSSFVTRHSSLKEEFADSSLDIRHSSLDKHDSSFFTLHSSLDKVVFCVPSGNFGNICSALFGHVMGLPVERFIASNNANDVVYQYLQTGIYSPRPSVQTIANAMDVGDPSNFARILDLYSREDVKERIGFSPLPSEPAQASSPQPAMGSVSGGPSDGAAPSPSRSSFLSGATYTDAQIAATMRDCYARTGYVLDPHGACAYQALKDQLRTDEIGIFLETAHPAKFKQTVDDILGTDIPIPERLQAFMRGQKQSTPLSSRFEDLKALLLGTLKD